MLCPYCHHPETKVIDKRDVDDMTRRRRECLKCERRFNTREMFERADLIVIKKDGRREPFQYEKVKRGVLKACEKRQVSLERIEKMIAMIEEKLQRRGKEVESRVIGNFISQELKKIDKIAYIRFASVYKDFTDIEDFKKEIKDLIQR